MSLFPRLTLLAASLMAASVVQAAPRKAAPAPATANWAGKILLLVCGALDMNSKFLLPAKNPLMTRTGWGAWLMALIVLCALVPVLNLAVPKGSVSFEVRHLLRDPIDATIAMLTNCVPPLRFAQMHHRFLAEQDKWFAIAQKVTPEQTKRWNEGAMPVRMRLIASDLK